MDEVDLAQVGLGGVPGEAGAVLDGGAQVGVALDAESGQEADAGAGGFGEGVGGVGADRGDGGVRGVPFPLGCGGGCWLGRVVARGTAGALLWVQGVRWGGKPVQRGSASRWQTSL